MPVPGTAMPLPGAVEVPPPPRPTPRSCRRAHRRHERFRGDWAVLALRVDCHARRRDASARSAGEAARCVDAGPPVFGSTSIALKLRRICPACRQR